MVENKIKVFDKTEKVLKYLITTPSNYSKEEKLPLLVFLHGAGERGDNLELVKVHGIPKLFSKNPDYGNLRVVTLSPQCPNNLTWYDFKWEIVDLIKDTIEEYNIDKNHVSLSGISMGGFGTWEIAIQSPDLFSCIAPICGGGTNFRTWYIRNIPTRVYHGKLDDTVPISYSESMVNSLKQQGGIVDFIVYDDLSHDCWTRAFEQTDLIQWLAKTERRYE